MCRVRYSPSIATITIATLCSSAVQRDGLLSMLEAGLEQFTPDAYPAVLVPILVVRIDFAPGDFGQVTELGVTVQHEDGEQLSEIGFGITYEPPAGADPRLAPSWVLIHQLSQEVRRDGLHSLHISLNGELVRELPFVVASRPPA